MFELINPNYKETKFYEVINKFYASPIYIAIVALVAVLSNLFGLEGCALIFYMFISAFIPLLFTDNLNPLIAPVFFGYITVSKLNNFSDYGVSLLSQRGFVPLCIICGVILGLMILTRILLNVIVVKKKYTFPTFLVSILIFLVASTLGGINTPYYAKNTIVFGLMVGLFMLVPYIGMYFVVDFKKIKDDYFGYILLTFAMVLIIEETYAMFPEIMTATTVNEMKNICRTGWGICNNIGAELVLSLGGSAYLAIKHRGGFFYLTVLMATYVAILFTFSRDSIIFGFILLVFSIVLIFLKGNKKRRIEATITIVIFTIVVGTLYYLVKERLNPIFSEMLRSLVDGELDDISSGRLELYTFGFNQYVENPIFGVGYFKLDIFDSPYLITGIVPSRYHNTIIQLLASTGTVGLLAYTYHRLVNIKHFIKYYSTEKLFIGISIMGLLLTSLLDCHLFNLGPTMEYSTLLLLFEGDTLKKKLMPQIKTI